MPFDIFHRLDREVNKVSRRETVFSDIYMNEDKSSVERPLRGASYVGVEVLYLTAATSIASIRERDVRNGFCAVT